MTKIAMIVLNAVSHDIRVLKQARSLASNHYDVTIIGVLDKHSLPNEEIDGVKIQRVGLQQSKTVLGRLTIKKLQLIQKKIKSLLFVSLLFWCAKNFTIVNFLEWLEITGKILNSNLTIFSIYAIIFFSEKLVSLFSKIYNPLKQTLVSCLRLSKELLYIFRKRSLILRQLDSIEPNTLHCHDLNALMIGVFYKKKKNCKLIYDSHEIFECTTGSYWPRRLFFTWIQWLVSRKVDGFITINQSIANYLEKKYTKLPPAKIIKNAGYFKEIVVTQNYLKKHLNIERNRKILLFQGGFSEGRGLIELISASVFLNPEWAIVMMGWGKLEAKLKQLAKNLRTLDSSVYFCNKVSQEDLPYWTAGATIGIIPYQNICLNHLYCTPNKLWEYPLANVPILASPFPEMTQIIEQGVGWLLDEPLTANCIAESINNLSEDSIKAAKLKCYEFIKEDNWSKYEQNLLDLYRTLSKSTLADSIQVVSNVMAS